MKKIKLILLIIVFCLSVKSEIPVNYTQFKLEFTKFKPVKCTSFKQKSKTDQLKINAIIINTVTFIAGTYIAHNYENSRPYITYFCASVGIATITNCFIKSAKYER